MISGVLLRMILCLNVAFSFAASAVSTIERTVHASDEQAQKGWKPMKDTLPALASLRDGVPTLEFRCNFAGTRMERASWDHAVDLDLSDVRGVQFEVYCPDSSPVSYFSLYFQTAGGWHHLSWFPEQDGAWQTITVNKADMAPEGSPSGWDKLTTIRISAWRSEDRDTKFLIRGLRPVGKLGLDAFVAVLRDAGWTWAQKQSVDRLVGDLRGGGIECAELDGMALSAAQLQKAWLVVLPQGNLISDAAIDAIVSFAKQGGKVLAFPGKMPEAIRASLNLPGREQAGLASTNCILLTGELNSQDAALRRQTLLAMAGWLVPDLWRSSIAAQEREMAEIGSFKSIAQITNHVLKLAGKDTRLKPVLAAALSHKEQANRSIATGDFPEAMNQTRSAGRKLLEAFCMAQEAKWPEFRGFWCHSAYGVKGMSWDQAISRLSSNGFTAIVPNMLWGGAAFYNSKVLPRAKEYTGPDQVAECLAACRKHGLEMHVWKVNWYLGSPAPAEFAERMKKEGRLQVGFDAAPHNWLCPSHPENRKLEIAAMVEVVRDYAVDGVHFDYIRYPGNDHCFCQRCKTSFEQKSGMKLARWPADIRSDAALEDKWNEWRRGNITQVVKAVSEQARAVRPGIKISAAVFRDWERDRNSVAQDWKLWCDRGYLDFVCPMDYTPSVRNFENSVVKQIAWAGKVPCYPGLGVSASRTKFEADRAIEEILVTRKHNTGGFMIFNYGQKEADELVPLLGLGITARQ